MNTKSLFVRPLQPQKGPLQPHKGPAQLCAMKPKVFEIEGSNFVSKPLKGRKTAWRRLLERTGPRVPPRAAPRGPQDSPKTALSHKIQSLRNRKFKFCNRASLRKGSYMVEAGRPRPPPCPAPRGPLDSPKTALSHKIQSLPDRVFKFCSRASLGKGSCMVEAGRPRSPPCATPWGPQNSPKTALSHKIQSLQDRKYHKRRLSPCRKKS